MGVWEQISDHNKPILNEVWESTVVNSFRHAWTRKWLSHRNVTRSNTSYLWCQVMSANRVRTSLSRVGKRFGTLLAGSGVPPEARQACCQGSVRWERSTFPLRCGEVGLIAET
jgi:hypothetical protein